MVSTYRKMWVAQSVLNFLKNKNMKQIQIDLQSDKGNILEIIGICARAIQKAAGREEKHIFTKKVVTECKSYREALLFCVCYMLKFDVEIIFKNEINPLWVNRINYENKKVY